MPTDPRLGQRAEVVRGTLEMLALKLLSEEPMHGWGLSLRLREISRDVFDVNQGSLYPALQAMLRRGWIRAEWRASENNRRARYYEITAEGRRQLDAEIEEWNRTSAAVNRVLRYAFQGA
jgi:transcriptional regulator